MRYVVIGWTGDYSERIDWPVVCVTSEDRAKEIVSFLTDLVACSRLNADLNADVETYFTESDPAKIMLQDDDPRIQRMKNWDRDFKITYPGVNYYYWSVPDNDNFPK